MEAGSERTNGQSSSDQKLPVLLMAYMSATYDTTGYSPEKLMFGHELRLPVDLLVGKSPGKVAQRTPPASLEGLNKDW